MLEKTLYMSAAMTGGGDAVSGNAPHGQSVEAFLEAMPAGFAALSADCRFVYVNARAERLWGMRRQDLIGRTPGDVFGGSQLELEFRKAMDGDAAIEFELFTPSSQQWLSYKMNPAPPAGLSVFFEDIRLRKLSEGAAARLAAIVDSSDDAIITKDLNGVIRTWNRSAERVFGYTAEETVGKSIMLLIPPGRHDEETELLSRLRRGESVDHFETVRRRKDGSLLDVSLTISPIKDSQGNVIGASKIAHDITERRSAESSTRLLGAIVDSSDDAIISKTLDGNITSWNKSAERLLGYTAEEAIGQSIMMIIPADRVEEEPKIVERLKRGERVDHFETVRRRKDGTLIDLSLTISPIKDSAGCVVGASKIARDITERKRIDNELRRANKDLEQFAFSASHDLQEPLRTMKIYAELLATRYANIVEGEPAEFLGYIRQAASRMEALVRDLLAYTQVSRLDRPAEAESAGAALEAAISMVSASLSESGGRVTFDPLPAVRVHGTHLRLLFQNLIGNAIKYRKPDRPPAVHVSASRQSDSWIFSVRDNGIGIEPEYKEQIFDLFTRLHTGEQYSGTGIGLAICQRIVDRYHGRIWVESQPGEGSAFSFSVPV
jgi:PAS domain S-box-containing protein